MTETINFISETVGKLSDISQKNECCLNRLVDIWRTLPSDDSLDNLEYLVKFNQCIEDIGDMVEDCRPDLSGNELMARKYQLLADVLNLKAKLLEKA